ncbi:hypothetical protein NPX13_g3765 [Xylaria arbuscula]|uniref:Protein kinase domain-containing protein n=1 Tax=Xylaria arbuscula TaxID=114810 RepID=A0A9W8NH47_9PEZI|nr:hypothetical protein NPX13_g3765 [Xylaria arbuscula]
MDNTTGRALLNLGLDLADVRRHQALLQQYFQRDEAKRFELVSAISSGQYSVAWKLKFRETPTSDVRYIVLKTDRKYTELRNDDDDSQDDDDNKNMDVDDDSLMSPESQTPNEKNRLEALQWAKHVVSGVEVTSDPLGRVFPDVPSHQMDPDSWLYIEYLENGTISNFLQKARQKKMVIPNRILWRFFMCLLRMVVAMGWPPAKPDGEEPKPVQEQISGPPTGGLRHNDMHEENIMLGNMIQSGDADLEHSLTPILCLIDLGAMDKVPDTPEHNMAAVRSNIFDIGLVRPSLSPR